MKTPCRLASSLFLFIAAACAFEAPPTDPGGNTAGMFAFVDVNVIPMDRERVLEGQTVVVADGRIKSIDHAATSEIPAGARRIEAAGRYLIPALSDMHVHLEGDAWNGMFPPEDQFCWFIACAKCGRRSGE